MSKKLLEESTIRQFMKLAQLEPLSENFFEEGRRGKKKSKRMRMREEQLEEEIDASPDVDLEEGYGSHDSTVTTMEEEVSLEEMMYDLEEEDVVMEEEDDEMEVEDDMEVRDEAGDMEAEINITPDQARAIIAVADMLKDIMPDLEAPEAEEEEEVEMDLEEPVDMGDEEEEEGEEKVAAGEDEEEEGAEEEALAEAVMRRVKARLREMKNK